jgi:hypothetical protein
VEPLDDDAVRLERALERRPACAEHGQAIPDVDRPAGGGPGAQPPFGYVVSFVHHHERGFAAPASCFMRGLCYHYIVELHNFVPNAISQAATFVDVCEGFLGIPANVDLWVHLFRAELHTLSTLEPWVRCAVHASGMSISLREPRRELPTTLNGSGGGSTSSTTSPASPLHRQGPEGEG